MHCNNVKIVSSTPESTNNCAICFEENVEIKWSCKRCQQGKMCHKCFDFSKSMPKALSCPYCRLPDENHPRKYTIEEEICLSAIRHNPFSIKYINNPTEEMRWAALGIL